MSSLQENTGQNAIPEKKIDADRAPYKRREDSRLTTGQGQFVDDFNDIGGRRVLHMLVVRSPYAHARIKNLNLQVARSMIDVVSVFGGEDFEGEFNPLTSFPVPGLKQPKRLPLAVGTVRYVGDPVAVVLASSLQGAQDAASALSESIIYEPLPVTTDPEAALENGAPLLYPEFGSNIAFVFDAGGGDIEKAFKEADKVINFRVVNQRIAPSSIEGRAVLFDYNKETGSLEAWLSTQAAYRAKEVLAAQLKLDKDKVRVRVADVGGGFGAKTGFPGEELVAAWLSKRTGQPVKWVEGRSENLQSNMHGRGQTNYVEAAVRRDGKLLGIRVNTIADLGSWLAGATTLVPTGTPRMLNGVYALEAIATRVVGVFTNKVPTSAYRGAGRPEAAYILERAMTEIARELDLDPAEVRFRNFIPPEAFPYQALTGVKYDSGNYAAALHKVLELAGYEKWRAQQRSRREQKAQKQIGIGIGAYLEIAGGAGSAPGAPQEAATVLVRSDGSVVVQSGVATNGQGHFTAFAQIAAGILGLPVDKVEVQMNDTALPAYGIGTFGSRTTAVAGSTIFLAAEAVRNRLLQGAGRLLEAAEPDLEMADGKVSVRGVPGKAVDFASIASAEEGGRISEWRDFNPSGATFPAGTHLAVSEVDTETGDIQILEYVAVDDCGRILNDLLADGQVQGGLAQGISQALYEEIVYDETGQLISGTLMDYTVPTASQVPYFKSAYVQTPSPLNPLGAKGIGEAGCTGGPPAIVNSVLDALAPLGVVDLDMPLKPERIWQAIEDAKQGVKPVRRKTNAAVFKQKAEEKAEDGTYTFE